MTTEEKLKHCRGCRNDFYNGTGAAQCWSLKDAKLVKRYAIGMPMDTAKNLREVTVFQCFHGEGPYRDVYLEHVPSHLASEWAQLRREKKRNESATGEPVGGLRVDPVGGNR